MIDHVYASYVIVVNIIINKEGGVLWTSIL